MDVHIENDKTLAPYLLAASFSGLISYIGNYSEGNILYLKFQPKNKALILIDQLNTKTAPPIQPKDIFQAIEFFWKQVSQLRNGEIKNGEH
jgi:hypothetical protein